MPYCTAFGCKTRHVKGGGIYFHAFPKDRKLRKQWVHYCRRANFKEPGSCSKLCSKHFSRDQYARDPKWMLEYGYEKAQPKLKGDAVPDLPLENEETVIFEPRHDKTYKTSVRPAKTQISLGIHPV